MYKPNVKKELEDDPEDFLREIIEGHIAHSIKRFTDISQAQAEKYESEYKRLKEWLEDAPVHFGIPHLHDPHELSEQAISEHVEIMLEARSIFFDFMFGKDRDKEQNKT